jgi:predicted Zn finger-like uncharacterized protein
MLISCPNCATSYEVDRTSLGSSGRSVRCLRCRHVWFVSNPAAFANIANAHRADMTTLGWSTGDKAFSPTPAPDADNGDFPPVSVAHDVGLAPDGDGVYVESPAEYAAPLDGIDAPDATEAPGAPPHDPADARELPAIAAADAPALAPEIDVIPARPDTRAPAPDGSDIETVAARRRKRRVKRRRINTLQGLTTTILTLVAILTGLLAWRVDIVRWMPQTAALYAAIRMPVNLRGLEFANVRTETDSQDGVPVLVVAGEIVSQSRHTVEVPRLRFAVRNDSGKELYAWTALPSRVALTPGDTLAFRSRLASPPREGQQVLVRFFNRRDLAAGLP